MGGSQTDMLGEVPSIRLLLRQGKQNFLER